MFETLTKNAQGITQWPTLKYYDWFKTFSCIGQFNWSNVVGVITQVTQDNYKMDLYTIK